MSYIYYLDSDNYGSIDETDWFIKSYQTLDDLEVYDLDLVDKEYERKFNLKLHYQDNFTGNIKPIVAIEFPNEYAATLFFLKWM